MGTVPRQQQKRNQQQIQIMKTLAIFLCAVIGGSLSKATLKAASRDPGCNCQCSNLQFKDKYGRIQGNCNSADNGAHWCYVDRRYNDCRDLRGSDRFHRTSWSYQACATPDRNSRVCRRYLYGGGCKFGNCGSGSGSGCRFGNCGGGSGSHFGQGGSGSGSGCRFGNCGSGSGSHFGQGGSGSGSGCGFGNCGGGSSNNFGQGGSGGYGSGLTLGQILASKKNGNRPY